MMTCPECGRLNQVGELQCVQCGTDLYDSLLGRANTKRLSNLLTRDLADTSELKTLHPLVLYVSQDMDPLAVARQDNLVIGRTEGDDEVPIDLGPYEAQAKGVSRKHAQLNASTAQPLLIDLDSYNGTYINGEKLVPQRPYRLNSGDEIRLARLLLRVYFK